VTAKTINVNFPKAGMGIDEGTVTRWLKAIGNQVRQGEPLVEIETAKAMQEIAAPASGTLVQILVPEGETATVNTLLGVIEEHRG
jgi:pyruvate/2-oxoglutarate dehydrogenase complex dihydrolipoamide acyltransferase (E2) component